MKLVKPRSISRWFQSLTHTQWLIAAVFIIGFLLRVWQFGQIPVSLYWDEAAMLVDAKAVAETGRDMHGRGALQSLFPSYGDYKLPVYIWLASIAMKFLGVNELALRLPGLLAGLATMVVASRVVSLLFGNTSTDKGSAWKSWITIATLSVVAVSPWAILFSRVGFEGYVGQALVGLAVVSQLLSKKNLRWLVLAPLLAALATYTYFSVRFVWPFVFVVIQALLYLNWADSKLKLLKTGLLTVVLPLTVYGLLLIPMMVSPLYQISNQFRLGTSSVLNSHDYAIQSNQLREQGGNSVIDRIMYHRYVLMLREAALNFSDHLNPVYIFISGDSNLRHGTGRHGLFLWPFIIPWAVGFFFMFKNYPKQFFVLLAWWLVALVPASIPETTPHALRSLNALIPLSGFIGVGLAVLIELALRGRSKSLLSIQKAMGAIWLGVVLFAVAELSVYYFSIYPQKSAVDWQGGYKELAQFIDARSSEVTYLHNEFTDIRFYLWLMAFTDIPAKEFASWQSQNWTFSQIGTIKPQLFEPSSLTTGSKVGIVLRTTELAKREPDWATKGVVIESKRAIDNPLLYDEYSYVVVSKE